MKLVFMNGGLANQLFQYIFFRWLEIKTGEECIIEDSAFFGDNVAHNGYEFEKIFGLHPKRLSQYFDKDVWLYMIKRKEEGKSIPQQLLENGLQLSMIIESGNIDFQGNYLYINSSNSCLNQVKGNWYYHGYWMNENFMNQIEPIIRKELQFPVLMDEKNKEYEQLICNTLSIAIHVRRGDMVKLGRSMDADYYRGGIEKFEQDFQQARYFIFSDDLKWCKENVEAMGLARMRDRVTFIEGNSGKNAFKDLYLMSICKHALNSWSSFSFLAGFLNKNPAKVILSANWSGL